MKFRPHRGSLTEAMAEVHDVGGLTDVAGWLSSRLAPFGICVESGDLRTEPYGFDDRIGWDTHIVLMRNINNYFGSHMEPDYFGCVGFTNGELK